MKMVGGFQSWRDSHLERTLTTQPAAVSKMAQNGKKHAQTAQPDIDQLKKLLPGMNGTKSKVSFISQYLKGRDFNLLQAAL